MKETMITSIGGCDIIIPINDREAFDIEAIHWSHEKVNELYHGSLVLKHNISPVVGPHDITISMCSEYGAITTTMVYGVRLFEEMGEEVSWAEAKLNKAYKITAQDFTGWREAND